MASKNRTAVANARQQPAKPALKSGDGRDVPCQPRRNSSISFAMLHITSPARQFQSTCSGRENSWPLQALLALFHQAGDTIPVHFSQENQENDMARLSGKVAVITGATSGIGLRTAEVFVAEGAKVVIAGRRVAEGEQLAGRLGANCLFRQTDVMVEDQVRALIELAVDRFGRLDCLFNNAGG